MTRWRRKVALAFALAAVLGACRQQSGSGPASEIDLSKVRKHADEAFSKAPEEAKGSSTTITAKSVQFRPNPNTVVAGSTITWVNADSFTHKVVSGKPGAPDGKFEKELVGIGISLEYTFAEKGTFEYFCSIHPEMTGSVIVQ